MAALKWIAGALACSLLFAGDALAQAYPNKAVRMLVPFAAGGPTDVIARIVGRSCRNPLGQQFVVENVGVQAATPARPWPLISPTVTPFSL